MIETRRTGLYVSPTSCPYRASLLSFLAMSSERLLGVLSDREDEGGWGVEFR